DPTHQANRGDHWVLDLDGGTSWGTAAPLPNPRDHLGYAGLGGKAYAVGGQHLDETSTNQAEVDAYDPATDTWTPVAPLPIPTGHNHTSTFVLNGRVVVAGGETNGARFPADVRGDDPHAHISVAPAPLPAPRPSGRAAPHR